MVIFALAKKMRVRGFVMSFLSDKRKRKIVISLTLTVIILAGIFGACALYLGDYYRADMDAIEAFSAGSGVEYRVLGDNAVVFEPQDAAAGLIFYPGGKVEHTAYLPLMEACAAEGVLCVLVEMPFRLAVLDVNAADGIREAYPEIENWYIGGHSLGGSMAASYLSEHTGEFEGLVLLGSYSTASLSASELSVLSVYGSEDMVMNREKYKENLANLPETFTEIVIEGGCHAYFGMYGAQDGDGVPAITNEEQIVKTADAIVGFINAN